jgi:large subunit ribosomal protein L16
MLSPSRVKWRKTMRGKMRGKAYRGSNVDFGNWGLMALEPAWITANQIESARIAVNRKIKKYGKLWIRIFPDKPYSKKPAETRMGSGKGGHEGFVAVVRPGKIMFEVVGPNVAEVRKALYVAACKLPIRCKIVEREVV